MMQSSKLLQVIEGCWAAIQGRHPEVPDVILILASGQERGKLVKLGHFAALAWQPPKGGARVSEVLVSGEALDRPAAEVMGTIVHEAVHALAMKRRIQDTSRDGRYHNKEFARLARELGLSVEASATYGQAHTKMTKETIAFYADCIKALDTVPRAKRTFGMRGTPPPPKEDEEDGEGDGDGDGEGKGKSKNTRALLAECECTPPRKIRMSKSTFDRAPTLCVACGAEFQLVD